MWKENERKGIVILGQQMAVFRGLQKINNIGDDL
jgi:hypothetical protein